MNNTLPLTRFRFFASSSFYPFHFIWASTKPVTRHLNKTHLNEKADQVIAYG
jgi:hypothetical protein